MKQSLFLYGPSGRGLDPRAQNPPVYYQPVYYPYPYYGPPVNPYEAARQAEGADQIAKVIWILVLVVALCAVAGLVAFVLMLG